LTTSGLAVGSHTITAVYGGDSNFQGSTSAALTETISPVPAGQTYSLWNPTATPTVAADPDTGSVEVGVKFRVDTPGTVTGVRFYKDSTNTGTHVGNLWTSTGQLLATATFTNETASGWQTVTFASPVAINANTTYVVSYFAPAGHYADDTNYFATAGVNSGPLHALADGVDGPDGVYAYGSSSSFPTNGYEASNYWVDVLFRTPATPAGPVAGVSGPAIGVPGQALTYTLTASDPNPAAGKTFTFVIDWYGNGTFDQTVSGPSGMTVSHVFAGPGTFTVKVTAVDSAGASSTPASAAVGVTAAALETDPTNASQTALFVGGTTGTDAITIAPADASGNLLVTVNGVNAGPFHPSGHIIVYAQAGNDTIRLVSKYLSGKTVYVTAPAFLFGGGGNDTLDVRGSTANNVLVGSTGNDTLYGGRGRDLLIGGAGADSLYAGKGQDILIAGATDFDNNLLALNALLAEWGRTDVGYSTRVQHLTGSLSGGLNGGYFLNAGTVHDDQATDYLYGNANVLDWFLANSSGPAPDKVSGVRSGAVVTAIN
jgi:Ca2+-binding RTX toxin-like protein